MDSPKGWTPFDGQPKGLDYEDSPAENVIRRA